MKKELNKGRIPVEQRATQPIRSDQIYQDVFKLDDALKAELKEKGLEGRFINYKKYRENFGFHRSGWTPFKRTSKDTSPQASVLGADPDGFVRRGDCILAVKTAEQVKLQRDYLAQKNAQVKSNYNKTKAQELRDLSKQYGVSSEVEIHEGFDQNGDEDDE